MAKTSVIARAQKKNFLPEKLTDASDAAEGAAIWGHWVMQNLL